MREFIKQYIMHISVHRMLYKLHDAVAWSKSSNLAKSVQKQKLSESP